MWTCPTCGRSFERTRQDHYCVKPETIDEYIAMQPEHCRDYLQRTRRILAAALPDAREKISWSMPTFWEKRNIIQFAAFQKHLGLYPGPEAVEAFGEELKGFYTSKGTVRLPYDQPLPEDLIARIALWCRDNRGARPKG